MASERTASISSSSFTSSSGHRTSTSSFKPPPLPPLSSAIRTSNTPSYQLPPLPPSSESLVAGTFIPATTHAAPASVPKEPALLKKSLPVPVTPQRKPVLRQKSPLSNEAYVASPPPPMPGSFPATPPPAATPLNNGLQDSPFGNSAYAAKDSPSPNSKSPKRPGSLKSILSFKAFRKSYDKSLPDRPPSAGGDSTLSSGRPSLHKKKSGSFWKRASSIGMNPSESDGSSPNPSQNRYDDGVIEEEPSLRSPTPAPGDYFPPVQKRKSGTFWRRRSSLGLATVFGKDDGSAHEATNGDANGNTNGVPNGTDETHKSLENGGPENEKQLPDLPLSPSNYPEEELPKRSYSPPPQIPEFVGAGSGLGGEDMFKDIR